MNLNDYILNQDGKDWTRLLSAWKWLLPESFTVWIVNRFGDLILIQEDGSVLLFDPGSGKLDRVASNQEEFARLADNPENFAQWFMPELVDLLVQMGRNLSDTQCHGYKLPPFVGGTYDPSNIEATDLSVHYHVLGQIFEQIKDVSAGTQIKIKIKNSEPE